MSNTRLEYKNHKKGSRKHLLAIRYSLLATLILVWLTFHQATAFAETYSPVDLGREEQGNVVQLWGKYLTFLEVNNKESETGPFAKDFKYEVYGVPNMDPLRQEAVGQDYGLDDVVASGSTEFEKMCLLGDWIRFQIPNFGGPYNPYLQVDEIDPFLIWPRSRQGEPFLCMMYAGTFIHSALSMGWNARWLTIKHSPDYEGAWHEVTELWSNQYDKWIMIDPTYNIYYEKDGIPLSGYEIRTEWLKNEGADMQMRSLEHYARPMENHTDRFFWIMVLGRNNFFSQRGDVWGKSFQFKDEHNAGLSWSGHVGSVTTIVSDPEEFWWPLNRATIHLYPGEQDTLLVELETFTPNFDSLWINIDGTGWQEIAESNSIWNLREGDNSLRAKARNKFGVDGSESFISISMLPDTIPPLPPTDLVSTAQTESSITLYWTAPSAASDGDLASSYLIFRDGIRVGHATDIFCIDTGLAPETTYNYEVYSVDDAGNQSTSATTGTFTTLADTTNTYTLTVTAVNGSVTITPNQASYNYGTTVTLQAVANAGYNFTSWSGDAAGGSNPLTLTIDSNKSVTANFTYSLVDETPPAITGTVPKPGSIQVPLNNLVSLNIVDSGEGVDANSATIRINGSVVYTGNTPDYTSETGYCRRIGTKANYTFIYQSNENFGFDQQISVAVNATDLASNEMAEYSYSFKTEMRSFGGNIKVNSNTLSSNGMPVTVRDGRGNIWTAWHTGRTGSRDVCIGKLTAEAKSFSNITKIRDNSTDQCNPDIAVDSDDKLYVAWQDNRRGNWDIYISTSNDGTNWSIETRITDSNDNQINPAIVVDSSNNTCIVWEDDRNGNQDIYITTSSDGFVPKQITADSSDQSEPAIAADSDNTIYVVWTDTRNGKNDIYGAASNNDPWTNIPIVNTEDSQSCPAIATEAVGSILHLVWVDDTPGDDDIYYAQTSGGLPTSPLTGRSIIDDTTNADQLLPVIAVGGSTGNNLQVFACWQDERGADDDLYFVEISSGNGTNVFVDDDSTSTDQTEPAIGIDEDGHPYLVWTDNRNKNTDIYYAGSTVIGSKALASSNISTSSTTTVETADEVSIVVPAGAYPCDIKITISEVKNPPKTSKEYLSLPYDFGPSGIEFDQPVTITIPYEVPTSDYSVSAYWYNLLTAAPSQQGITDIETIVISSTSYLRFKTTHFTQFFVGGSSSSGGIGVSGGGGGGGCSMSPDSQASIVELLLPYMGLTVVMVILKLRNRRKRKACNIRTSDC